MSFTFELGDPSLEDFEEVRSYLWVTEIEEWCRANCRGVFDFRDDFTYYREVSPAEIRSPKRYGAYLLGLYERGELYIQSWRVIRVIFFNDRDATLFKLFWSDYILSQRGEFRDPSRRSPPSIRI